MRVPEDDSGQPASPVDWTDIPLAPGQVPGPLGYLQHTKEGDVVRGTDVRRAPGYESVPVVGRYPERPV